MLAQDLVDSWKKQKYYILKHGYYYRPDAKGYTVYKHEAGQFTYDEMKSHLEHCDELTSKPITLIP